MSHPPVKFTEGSVTIQGLYIVPPLKIISSVNVTSQIEQFYPSRVYFPNKITHLLEHQKTTVSYLSLKYDEDTITKTLLSLDTF